MTDTKLLPTRCIVDRTVLVKLLETWWAVAKDEGHPLEPEFWRLFTEVEYGQRVELYERDWPGSAGE